jgi:hypothetical protein
MVGVGGVGLPTYFRDVWVYDNWGQFSGPLNAVVAGLTERERRLLAKYGRAIQRDRMHQPLPPLPVVGWWNVDNIYTYTYIYTIQGRLPPAWPPRPRGAGPAPACPRRHWPRV